MLCSPSFCCSFLSFVFFEFPSFILNSLIRLTFESLKEVSEGEGFMESGMEYGLATFFLILLKISLYYGEQGLVPSPLE